MLTKAEIRADIEKKFKSALLFKKHIREYTNFDEQRVNKLVQGLPNFGGQRKGQLYHYLDVADRLHECQKY
jgi:hypothetical protein